MASVGLSAREHVARLFSYDEIESNRHPARLRPESDVCD
jgi:hypothetical protein